MRFNLYILYFRQLIKLIFILYIVVCYKNLTISIYFPCALSFEPPYLSRKCVVLEHIVICRHPLFTHTKLFPDIICNKINKHMAFGFSFQHTHTIRPLFLFRIYKSPMAECRLANVLALTPFVAEAAEP